MKVKGTESVIDAKSNLRRPLVIQAWMTQFLRQRHPMDLKQSHLDLTR